MTIIQADSIVTIELDVINMDNISPARLAQLNITTSTNEQGITEYTGTWKSLATLVETDLGLNMYEYM